MATGDQTNMLARVKAVLPRGWFPDTSPVLDGVLSGPSYAWAWLYSMLAYVRAQARRLTASGVFLDMIATDFFGSFIARRVNESDGALSTRIGKELFREKGTRKGLISALTDLTGNVPGVFEPAYTNDTGGYSAGGTPFNGFGYSSTRSTPGTYFDATGTLQTAQPGVARPLYVGSTLTGIMSESARTNSIRNPRAEGAVTGIVVGAGAVATNWVHINAASGLILTVSPISLNGMTGMRLSYSGTSSASPGPETIEFETRTAIAAAAGQVWTGSVYYRLASGTVPAGMNTSIRLLSLTSGGAVVDNISSITAAPSATLGRTTPVIQTLSATAAFVTAGINFTTIPANTVVACAVDVFFPQLELGAFATSPILPAIGTPAATTRAADALASSPQLGGSLGYGVAGGYGSLLLPFQAFVSIARPHGQGVANVAGYGHLGGFNGMPGGYGVGAIEYVTPAMFASPVSDTDIYNVINDVRPVATIMWTKITDV